MCVTLAYTLCQLLLNCEESLAPGLTYLLETVFIKLKE